MNENSKASDMTEGTEGQKDKRGSMIKKFVGKRTKSTSQSTTQKNTMSEFKNSKPMTVSSSTKNIAEAETKYKAYMDPRVKKENRRAIKSMILPRSPIDDIKESPQAPNGKEETKKFKDDHFVDQLPKRSLSHHRRVTDMTTLDGTKKPFEKPVSDALENTKKPFEKPVVLDEPVRRSMHRPRAHRHSFHVGDIEKLNQAIEKENEKFNDSREDAIKMKRVRTKPRTEEKIQIIQDREPRKSNNASHSVEKKINFLINPQKQESKNPQIKKINFLINSNGSKDESEDEKDDKIPKIDIITCERETEKQGLPSDEKEVQNLPRTSKSEAVLYKHPITEITETTETKEKRIRTKSARIDKFPVGRHSDVKPKRNSLILRPTEVPNFFVHGRKDTQTTMETPITISLKDSKPENSEVKVTQIKDKDKRVKTHVRRAVSQDFALTYDKNLLSNKPKGILRVGPKTEKSGSAGSAKIALTQEEELRIKEKEGKPKLQRRSTRWIPPDYYEEKASINHNGLTDKASVFLKYDQEMEEREKEKDREKEREKDKDSESDKEQDKDRIKLRKKEQEKDYDLDREPEKAKPKKKNSFIFPTPTPNKSKNASVDEKYAKKRRRYSEIAFNRLKKSAGKKNKIEDDGAVKFTAQTKEKSPKATTPAIPSSKSVPSTPKCVARTSPPSSPKLTNKSPLRRSHITSHQID